MDQRRTRFADARSDGFRFSAFDAHAAHVLGESVGLDRVRSSDSCGLVVRVAFLCQGLAIDRASQSQHVHADRAWYGHGLSLQRLRYQWFLKSFRRRFAEPEDRSMCISNQPRSSSHWFF